MDVAQMRLLDRWIGVPACAALTLIRRLVDLKPHAITEPRRILFIKLAEQGATVLAEPALRSACARVGKENVFMAVFQQNRFIVDLLDVIPPENVIALSTTAPRSFFLDIARALRRLRRMRIDVAIDFEFFARASAILCFLSGASIRIGLHSYGGEGPYRGDLMTHRIRYNPFLHASELFEAMVAALDVNPQRLPLLDFVPEAHRHVKRFHPSAQELSAVERILKRELGDCKHLPPLILLNSNSGDLMPLRRWPRERYLDLARHLLQQYAEVCIAFTGSPDEAREAGLMAAEIDSPRCISLGGKTTLNQLLALYCLAEVLVTNDSGPAHYSALTPISVVALYGPETPAVFGPRTPRSEVFWAGIACSPCLSAFNNRWTACTDNVCMHRIGVDVVFKSVCRLYDQRCLIGGVNEA